MPLFKIARRNFSQLVLKSKAGFSLLEVVLALILFMILVGCFFQVVNNSIASIERTRYKNQASAAAATIMYTGSSEYKLNSLEEVNSSTFADFVIATDTLQYRRDDTISGSLLYTCRVSSKGVALDLEDQRYCALSGLADLLELYSDDTEGNSRGIIIRVSTDVGDERINYYYYRPFHPYSCCLTDINGDEVKDNNGKVISPCAACTKKTVTYYG